MAWIELKERVKKVRKEMDEHVDEIDAWASWYEVHEGHTWYENGFCLQETNNNDIISNFSATRFYGSSETSFCKLYESTMREIMSVRKKASPVTIR